MANYNPMTDVRNLISLPDIQGESIPKIPAFTVFPNEEISYETDGIMRYPANLSSLAEQPLTELTRRVLGVIATYEYVTTKMIVDFLGLYSIKTDSEHVLKATERLRKTGIIYSLRFLSENSKPTNFLTYTLTKTSGESAARNIGISPQNIENFNVVAEPSAIKQKLAVNQLLLAHLKRNTTGELSAFEKSKRITFSTENDEKMCVRPSLMLTYKDKSTLLYEVVRKGEFWKSTLQDKLVRYKHMLDNWEKDNFTDFPPLIICCESEQHSYEVKEITDRAGINTLFTHDLLLFGDLFKHHVYGIYNGNIEYYALQSEQNASDIA